MNLIKMVFQITPLMVLVACGGQGPIKAYDEKVTTDITNMSILYLPPEIELIEADGKSFDTPFIETGYNEVHLSPGHHEIAVKYLKFWGDASSGSLISSKPVIYSLDLKAKAKYHLKFDKPSDQFVAQRMAQKFSPWIEDEGGVKVFVVSGQHGTRTLTNGTNKVKANAIAPQASEPPLDHLKFWWKNASFKEKKAFEGWMNQN